MKSHGENEKIYEFGDFRLIPAEELLLHHGSPIKINPKSFAVLVQLVEHHGHLLSKSEIIEHVWKDSFVEEGAIAKAVWFLRQALGDGTKERFIQTIPRRGYRFVAHVEVLNGSGEQAGAKLISTGFRLPQTGADGDEPPGSLETRGYGGVVVARHEAFNPDETVGPRVGAAAVPPVFRAGRGYGNWGLYAGIVAVVLAAVAVWATISDREVPAKIGAMRIAVLPFKAMDESHRDPLYELGITESLILKLASDKRMVVRQLSAVRPYVDKDEDPVKVGGKLKVDHVLSSNYQVANGNIKVTSQWVNVETGEVEDAFTVEREAAGNFTVQNVIAEEIGKRILARLGTVPMKLPATRGTENEEAYRLYLLGMNLSEERSVQNIEKALQYLEQSVALDPDYAAAWAGIALQHRDIVGHTEKDATEHYEQSMAAIKKALAIDPGLSDAYSALCGNKLRYEYDFTGAEAACKAALDLDPVSPVAYKNYAFFLTSMGRFDEAVAAIRTSMEIQPVSYRNQQIYALILYFAGRHGEEEEQWKRLIELNPNHSFIYGRISTSLRQQGKPDEAFEFLVRKMTLDKVDETSIQRLRDRYTKAGWAGVLESRLRSNDPKISLRTYDAACYYAGANMKDKAFEALEKAYAERSSRLAMIRVEPQFEPLRADPRFEKFVRKIETGK